MILNSHINKLSLLRGFAFQILIVWLVLGLTTFFVTRSLQAQETEKDVPYVPTPKNVVERMMELAEVDTGDYVIDLGSGDGRIVIEAARQGAVGHGVEIDPEKIAMARENAEEAEVDDQVMFLKQDLFKSDFSRASVVTMYLLPAINNKLQPKLMEELDPGTRIVSHSFDIDGWEADKKAVVFSDTTLMSSPVIDNVIYKPEIRYTDTTIFDSPELDLELTVNKPNHSFAHMRSHDVYMWIVPADAEGDWSWKTDGSNFRMKVKQNFQKVDLELTQNGTPLQIEKAKLKGPRLRVRASTENTTYLLSGNVEGDSISGYVQIRGDDTNELVNWDAARR